MLCTAILTCVSCNMPPAPHDILVLVPRAWHGGTGFGGGPEASFIVSAVRRVSATHTANRHFVLSLPVDKVNLSLVLGRLVLNPAGVWLGWCTLKAAPASWLFLCVILGRGVQCLKHCVLFTLLAVLMSNWGPSPPLIQLCERLSDIVVSAGLVSCCRFAHLPRPVCPQATQGAPAGACGGVG